MGPKSIKNRFKIDRKAIPAMDGQNSASIELKIDHSGTQNGRKIDQKRLQNRSPSHTTSNTETEAVSNMILKTFLVDFGSRAKAKILQNAVRGVQNHSLRIYNIER